MADEQPRRNPLDQGIAITGDLTVKLMGLNLLPINVRLLISSKDLATQLGLDWWREMAEGESTSSSTSAGDRPKREQTGLAPRKVSPGKSPGGRNGAARPKPKPKPQAEQR